MLGRKIQSLKKKKLVIILRKFLHTYLTPKFLWEIVIKNYEKHKIKSSEPVPRWVWAIHNIFWFWPTLHTSFSWRDVGMGGVMGPQEYETIGSNQELLVNELIKRASSGKCSFLDLGCNSGRFLNALNAAGFKNLYGVDISSSAIENMKNIYPDLYSICNVEIKTMQEYLLKAKTRSMDIIYTHGATVELIPSSFPLIREVCRVSKGLVIFYISEDGHHYPRFWEKEFSRYKFQLVKLERRLSLKSPMSLLVFEKAID